VKASIFWRCRIARDYSSSLLKSMRLAQALLESTSMIGSRRWPPGIAWVSAYLHVNSIISMKRLGVMALADFMNARVAGPQEASLKACALVVSFPEVLLSEGLRARPLLVMRLVSTTSMVSAPVAQSVKALSTLLALVTNNGNLIGSHVPPLRINQAQHTADN
jgi:hypothetical protein